MANNSTGKSSGRHSPGKSELKNPKQFRYVSIHCIISGLDSNIKEYGLPFLNFF